MKYPITPEYLEALPDGLVRLYSDLEVFVLRDICRRFKDADSATNTAIEQIKLLKRRGYDEKEIDKYIKETLKKSEAEMQAAWDDAVERNQRYYSDLLTKGGLTKEGFDPLLVADEVEAIRRQTHDEFVNLTQSMGFAVRGSNGQIEFSPIAETYQKILDNAEMQVWSGAVSYAEAIRNATKQLTDSGLQVVDYASGWHNRVDVAARRAIMTGASQISAKYSERIAEDLDTDYFEVTAHAGARDIDYPNPWSNHKKWQGKVYSKRSGDKYPSIYEVCGLGAVDGLNGANCRHLYHAFFDGISERTYTDEELANIDPPPFTYQGREYTAYEATQKQRQIERAIKKAKLEVIAAEESGDLERATDKTIRTKRLVGMYKDFSNAAGLKTQFDRTEVYLSPKTKSKIAMSPAFVTKNDDLFERQKKIKPIEGYEDVVVHSDKYSFSFKDADGNDHNVSVSDFADILKQSKLYNGGDIRLIACQAGAEYSVVAQGLADLLGVNVLAPNKRVYIDFEGNMTIGDNPIANDGKWVIIKPRKK